MRIFKPLPLVAVICFLMILACNTQNRKNSPVSADLSQVESEAPKKDEQAYSADSTVQLTSDIDKKQFQPPAKPDWNKKIIKNASLNIEVKNYKKFSNTIREITKKSGGYIAREEQTQSAYKLENTITIKVPVDQFEEAVNALTNADEKLIEKKIGSEDVTGEVIDTRSRIEAKRQVRLRYLELLKQAKNMSEVLQVQNEINDLQEEIESASGRVNYLTHAAALSTIQLTYFQVLNPSAMEPKDSSFGTRIVQSIYDGAKWIGELILLLLFFWPLWIGVGFGWVLFRRNRFTKNKHA